MKVTKNKDYFYGRKLDNVEINNAINIAITNLRDRLPDGFHIRVTRASDESIIRITFREDAYTPTCAHGFNDCIHDPAYKKYQYDTEKYGTYYRDRYTEDELLELVSKGCNCHNGCDYDDEDK